jgi:hypothetical protein
MRGRVKTTSTIFFVNFVSFVVKKWNHEVHEVDREWGASLDGARP